MRKARVRAERAVRKWHALLRISEANLDGGEGDVGSDEWPLLRLSVRVPAAPQEDADIDQGAPAETERAQEDIWRPPHERLARHL